MTRTRRHRRLTHRAEELALRIVRRAARRAARLRRRAERLEDSVRAWMDGMTAGGRHGAPRAAGMSEDDGPMNDTHDDFNEERGGSGFRRESRRSGRASGRKNRRTYRWRGLYRDPDRGKLGGVCAGLAEYLGLEPWQVRVCMVLCVFFMGSVTIPVYIIGWLVLDKRPYHRRMTDDAPGDEEADAREEEEDGRADPLRDQSNGQVLCLASCRFRELEARLRALESHVTSSRFELQREFRRLAD